MGIHSYIHQCLLRSLLLSEFIDVFFLFLALTVNNRESRKGRVGGREGRRQGRKEGGREGGREDWREKGKDRREERSEGMVTGRRIGKGKDLWR